MEIQYLGTAAAEGLPALFCDCETCRKARNIGGEGGANQNAVCRGWKNPY